MNFVQTHTVSGRAVSSALGYIYPTSQQPAYASRFKTPLENMAESGKPAMPFLSLPKIDGVGVQLGRGLSVPAALQTPVPATKDMTFLFAARLLKAPQDDWQHAGALGGDFYNSASKGGWNGVFLTIGKGNALLYVSPEKDGKLTIQYAGAALTDAQLAAWGLYIGRITSNDQNTTATIRAVTAGTEQTQTWPGTLYIKPGETPSIALGADYVPVFGTAQAVQMARAMIWNTALTDTETDAVAAMVKDDLEQDGITV